MPRGVPKAKLANPAPEPEILDEEAELQRMIDEEEAEKAAALAEEHQSEPEPMHQPVLPERTVEVMLVRAHWVGEQRHEPQEVLVVNVPEARRLIDAGVATRMDLLPGE